jgi:glutamate--cysteine ligase
MGRVIRQGITVSIPSAAPNTPINNRDELVAYLAQGEKPREAWRIGTEHEKFGFRTDDLRPPTFDGERGIRALLETIATRYGWTVTREGDAPVALTRGKANITLEPAGQLELSGAPLETIHDTCSEVSQHLEEVRSIADGMGLGFLGMGFQPKWRRDEMPWMPKGRYKIMREYMPKVGSLGLDMMTRTCTVQVNLDYATEADMIKKFRVALALQPIATALFADSPFTEGKPTRASATSATSTIFSTCRCTSATRMASTSTCPARASRISWPASSPTCPTCGRLSRISAIT